MGKGRDRYTGRNISPRKIKVGELLLTGQCKSMRDACTKAGYAKSTAVAARENGITPTTAIAAYNRAHGVKSPEQAAKKAQQMITDAMQNDSIDIKDRLNIARWVADHHLKTRQVEGDKSADTVSALDTARYRVAFMRAVQKGIALALVDSDRAVRIHDAISVKVAEIAEATAHLRK